GSRERIDDAAKPCLGRKDGRGFVFEFGMRAQRHTVETAKRHDHGAAIPEANDFAGDMAAARNGDTNLAAQTDGAGRSGDFDGKAFDARHPAEPAQRRYGLDFLQKSQHSTYPKGRLLQARTSPS